MGIHPETPILVNGGVRRVSEMWGKASSASRCEEAGGWRPVSATVLCLDEAGSATQGSVTGIRRRWVSEEGRRILLGNGACVDSTGAHPVLTPAGWRADPRVGDVVAVPRSYPWDGAPANPDFLTLLAWQITEGHEESGTGTVIITQDDRSTLERVRAAGMRFGAIEGIELNSMPIASYAGRAPTLAIHSVQYREWLANNGYVWGHASRSKSLPAWVVESSDDSLRLLLREMFAAESHVNRNGAQVEYSSASRRLAEQVQSMLLRLSIPSTLSRKRKMATNGARIERTYWSVNLTSTSARRFGSEIGFACEAKSQVAHRSHTREHRGSRYDIPVGDLLADAASITGLGRSFFGVTSAYMCGKRRFVSRDKAAALLERFDRILDGRAEQEHEEYVAGLTGRSGWRYVTQNREAFRGMDYEAFRALRNRLASRLDSDLIWVEVKAVESARFNGWVYALASESHHNYVAGGMVLASATAST